MKVYEGRPAQMDLSHLNPPQAQAVRTTEGPLLVLAGAGSGKTRVITHRIAYLLEKGVDPSAILAVTFTNKAAAEMKERVLRLAGKRAEPVDLCTFHAFGAAVMREHAPKLGYPKRFAIADMGDQIAIIKRAMRDRRVDDRSFDARRVLSLVSRAKNEGSRSLEASGPGIDDDYQLITSEIFPLYERALKAQGAVDFDDLIVQPIALLEKNATVRRAYQKRYDYLLVDEFQDTNRTQLRLLELIAGEKKNVCVVGDDDQCIYSWRGAEVENILRFDRAFANPVEVRLEQNYRSTATILDAANAVIAKNPNRKAKRLWTQSTSDDRVQLVIAPDEDEEARFVAHEIGKKLALGIPADQMAILYRTNGQSAAFEEALRAKSVPLEVIGGTEFFDRREVKDVVAYLKLVVNPRDEVSLRRIINVPARGIGDVTVEKLGAAAAERGVPLWDTLVEGEPREFRALIERYRALFTKGNLAAVCGRMLEEIGFREAARLSTASATAGDRKVRSIDHVLASLAAFEKRQGSDLLQYLNRLALDSRDEDDTPDRERVCLMTLHAAKGLEFRVVFLVGMEEGFLPHSGMQGEGQNLEEERRLCYVGMTRARECLYLTRAATRAWRGKPLLRTPSRFLEDVPAERLEVVDLGAPPPGPPTEQEKAFFSNLREKLKGAGAGSA